MNALIDFLKKNFSFLFSVFHNKSQNEQVLYHQKLYNKDKVYKMSDFLMNWSHRSMCPNHWWLVSGVAESNRVF